MNKKSKRRTLEIFLVFSLLCTSISACTAAPATEEEVEGSAFTKFTHAEGITVDTLGLEDEEIVLSTLTSILKDAAVKDDAIAVLLEKYKNDELWDSLKEEYRDLEPQILRDGYAKTTYPDGSFSEITVSKPASVLPSPDKNFTYYTGVKAAVNKGFVQTGFEIDYTVDHLLRKSQITDLYNKKLLVVPGTYSKLTSGHWPDFRDPSHGWISFDLTVKLSGDISGFGFLKLFVDGDGNTWIEAQV